MKIKIITRTNIIGGLSIVPFMSALAIEPPADDSQPPAALLEEEGWDLSQEATPSQKTPFFGIGTAAVPEMLADHLSLEPGSGLIVRTVYPGSPAAKAGLSVNDIILKVGETEVGSPDALTSVVSKNSVGDRVAIDLIHKGRPAKMEVTFAERPAELTGMAQPQQPMLEGLPKEHQEMLRGMIERNMQAFGSERGALPGAESIEKHFSEMRERMSRAMEENDFGTDREGINAEMNSTVRVMDGNGSIEIRTGNGSTNVTVRDPSSEITWSGPWDTDEEKASAPAEIRERVDRVKSGKGFRLSPGRMNGSSNVIGN
ncbi:MAG: S1C family serine protease [Luteolibacter sp.]